MSENLDEEINSIIDELVVEETGNSVNSITLNIQKLKEQGIVSISNFMTGKEDSFKGNEFDNSDPDYIKGYKYGQTGKF